MRRVIRRVVLALPFDAASRRALMETLLDWETEADSAKPAGRLTGALVGFRSCLALARAFAMTGWRELGEWPTLHAGARLLLIVIPLAAVWSATVWLPNAASVPYRYWPELWLARIAAFSIATLPLALFAVAATWPRQRRLPALGLLTFALSLCLLAAVTAPAAAEHRRRVSYDLLMEERGFGSGAPIGLVDRAPLEALQAAAGAVGASLRAGRIVVWTTMSAGTLGLWGLVGMFVRRIRPGHRRWWLAAVPVLYFIQTNALSLLPLTAWRAFEALVPTPEGRLVATYAVVAALSVGLPLVCLYFSSRAAETEAIAALSPECR